MNDEKTAFQPGEKIGDYEVISVLGVGATGTVYLAQHTVLKKLFAVKVLNGELAFMPEFVRIFQHEAQIVAALSHENIVPVHNFGECGGFYYYVMDFVNGGTLEDVRRRNGGRLRPEAAIALIASVARGLAYAHGYGVVHRDLKPENILLTRTGTPQITDFGMAYVDRRYIAGQRRMEERRRAKSSAKFRAVVGLGGGNAAAGTSSQTQIAIEENAEDKPEVEGGTEGYIAPEVARGNAATPRADVYALGALLHFLLVGETPPEPGRLSPEIFKLRNRPLTRLLECSLSLVPTRRYPTAKEFLAALERVGSAPARFRRTLYAAAAALLVAAAFAFAFSFGEKSQLRKTENRVAAAAQKIFETDLAAAADGKSLAESADAGEAPDAGRLASEKNVPLSVSASNPASAAGTTPDAARSASASSGVPASAESAEREYWERFCLEKTGRRGVVVGFLDDDGNAAVKKVSKNEMLYFLQHVPAGTYNIYFRTVGSGRPSAVPVRLSIGGDSVSRVMKFSGDEENSSARFFSIIDVSAASEHIRIEIPNTRSADVPEIGFSEIEIRPTFSNADFSRMFGEFLSVLSEK